MLVFTSAGRSNACAARVSLPESNTVRRPLAIAHQDCPSQRHHIPYAHAQAGQKPQPTALQQACRKAAFRIVDPT
ncbi:MAG TPA: hypothetical protein PLP92_17270, partial [Rhodocyclaceae bacterium]|nr:hypothetical protein [Rhodocyclaceae bacterium]